MNWLSFVLGAVITTNGFGFNLIDCLLNCGHVENMKVVKRSKKVMTVALNIADCNALGVIMSFIILIFCPCLVCYQGKINSKCVMIRVKSELKIV